MLLDRTIAQLDTGVLPQDKAEALARLGYLQWLGALRGADSYPAQAHRALARATPLAQRSSAVAAFCMLLRRSLDAPLTPLPLGVAPQRRGGARARRAIP